MKHDWAKIELVGGDVRYGRCSTSDKFSSAMVCVEVPFAKTKMVPVLVLNFETEALDRMEWADLAMILLQAGESAHPFDDSREFLIGRIKLLLNAQPVEQFAATEYYGPSAIFRITVIGEQAVREALKPAEPPQQDALYAISVLEALKERVPLLPDDPNQDWHFAPFEVKTIVDEIDATIERLRTVADDVIGSQTSAQHQAVHEISDELFANAKSTWRDLRASGKPAQCATCLRPTVTPWVMADGNLYCSSVCVANKTPNMIPSPDDKPMDVAGVAKQKLADLSKAGFVDLAKLHEAKPLWIDVDKHSYVALHVDLGECPRCKNGVKLHPQISQDGSAWEAEKCTVCNCHWWSQMPKVPEPRMVRPKKPTALKYDRAWLDQQTNEALETLYIEEIGFFDMNGTCFERTNMIETLAAVTAQA